MRGAGLRQGCVDGLYWLLLYAGFWALFAEGGGWSFGLPAVFMACALSLWLGIRPWRLRLSVLPGFVWFFLVNMFTGAWDVARRAAHPGCPLQPEWVEYPLAESSERVRILLSALVGLLPGTLASQIEGSRMQLHVLDGGQPWQATVADLEARLIRLLDGGSAR
ncbi:sodium:proton antiporter [Stutzerimonas nosocomialis]|uniref:Na+/H+ antiporter subunit E n=1 Tax=Stutzerimonas nosocomialis TaxID=1056496 RepID=UPI0011089436|nr:Na+/H+ antiporter subunit E [Stutzerimonas nosocomialis]TLX58785.1 sodium:proton antiporter [Stutzerimonas nosocomialis]